MIAAETHLPGEQHHQQISIERQGLASLEGMLRLRSCVGIGAVPEQMGALPPRASIRRASAPLQRGESINTLSGRPSDRLRVISQLLAPKLRRNAQPQECTAPCGWAHPCEVRPMGAKWAGSNCRQVPRSMQRASTQKGTPPWVARRHHRSPAARHTFSMTVSGSGSALGGNPITTQLGQQGLGQQPWWVEQWMELINSYRYKKRLERAWAYARSGNVISIRFEGRRVHARVQGTEAEPYKVKLWLDVLSDEDWGYVLEALGQKARWSAQLLAGLMPQDIERAFAASGRRLFPFKLQEVRSECSCPDKANPCKHTSAVYYLMGDRFSEDPFVLFQLRGRSRDQLLADLAVQRRKQLAAAGGGSRPAARHVPHPVHPAVSDPGRWWSYTAALDPDLVVITPAMEGDTGLDEAGELPLAAEPRFPEANRLFLERLRDQGTRMAQLAMAQAMGPGG